MEVIQKLQYHNHITSRVGKNTARNKDGTYTNNYNLSFYDFIIYAIT